MNKIINFHRVTNIIWLENVIQYLKSNYKFINPSELYAYYKNEINLHNACHITIDDGDKTFYDFIFPILKKHKVPASIYVSPKIIIDKSNYWFQEISGYDPYKLKQIISDKSKVPLNHLIKFSVESILKTYDIQQVHEIIKIYRKKTNTQQKVYQNMTLNHLKEVSHSDLIAIGAHTLNHPILHNEDDYTANREIKGSIVELSNLLNRDVKYFAYPNGIPNLDFTQREKKYLKELGVQLTFSTEPKNFSKKYDTLSIPRIGISDCDSINFFKTKMFLGSVWGPINKLKPTGEIQERKELKNIFNNKVH